MSTGRNEYSRHIADIAVIGQGPAGFAAAVTAARAGARVLSLTGVPRPGLERGETLPPIARKVLSSLGILHRFTHGQSALYTVKSAWGTADLIERNTMTSTSGDGILLNRRLLAEEVAAELDALGVARVEMTKLERVQRSNGVWRVETRTRERQLVMRTGAIIDASGRAAILARRLGAQRIVDDRLVAVLAHLGRKTSDELTAASIKGAIAGAITIEAVPYGWWYAAACGDGMAIALMTDSDLCRTLGAYDPKHWGRLLANTTHIRALVGAPADSVTLSVIAANSCRLSVPIGQGWIAAGDAAMAFDPLSSQGITVALMTGQTAAVTALDALLGKPRDQRYCRLLERVLLDYRTQLSAHYATNSRWPDDPFWLRRLRLAETSASSPLKA